MTVRQTHCFEPVVKQAYQNKAVHLHGEDTQQKRPKSHNHHLSLSTNSQVFIGDQNFGDMVFEEHSPSTLQQLKKQVLYKSVFQGGHCRNVREIPDALKVSKRSIKM